MTIIKLQKDLKKLKRKLNSRKYKVYTALLSQTGTSNPTVVVLENELGDLVWTRNNVGVYYGTLANAFIGNQTVIFINNTSVGGRSVIGYRTSANQINIEQLLVDGSTPADSLSNTSIEIRVY